MTAAEPPAPPSGRTRRPSRRLVIDVLGLVAGALVFTWLHDRAGTDVAGATAHAEQLQALERSLGLDVEPAANRWLVAHPTVAIAAVWYYRLYYLPLAGVLLWVLVRHGEVYRTVRRVLVVTAVIALLVFWALPMSPPRFAMPGIVDLVAQHDVVAGAASRDLSNGRNHFSAFPSLHVGWPAVCAYAAWLVLRGRHPRTAPLVWAFPLAMVAVVITTGNHYVLDVVGTAVLVSVAVAVAGAWARFWPRTSHTSPVRSGTTRAPARGR